MASASSLIQNGRFIEDNTQGVLIKALRAITGQYKIATDTVNNTTTKIPITEVSFNVQKGKNYILEAQIPLVSVAGGGFRIQVVVTGQTSPTVSGGATLIAVNTIGAPLTLNTDITLASAGAAYHCILQGRVQPDGDGVMTFSFAQQTATSGATSVVQGARFNLIELAAARRAPNVV